MSLDLVDLQDLAEDLDMVDLADPEDLVDQMDLVDQLDLALYLMIAAHYPNQFRLVIVDRNPHYLTQSDKIAGIQNGSILCS